MTSALLALPKLTSCTPPNRRCNPKSKSPQSSTHKYIYIYIYGNPPKNYRPSFCIVNTVSNQLFRKVKIRYLSKTTEIKLTFQENVFPKGKPQKTKKKFLKRLCGQTPKKLFFLVFPRKKIGFAAQNHLFAREKLGFGPKPSFREKLVFLPKTIFSLVVGVKNQLFPRGNQKTSFWTLAT